jgi:hypothetical protein
MVELTKAEVGGEAGWGDDRGGVMGSALPV